LEDYQQTLDFSTFDQDSLNVFMIEEFFYYCQVILIYLENFFDECKC